MLPALLALLKAIPVIGGWVDKIAGYLHDKGVKDGQQAKDQRDNAVAGMHETDKAQRARDTATGDIAADPGILRKPGNDVAKRGADGIS